MTDPLPPTPNRLSQPRRWVGQEGESNMSSQTIDVEEIDTVVEPASPDRQQRAADPERKKQPRYNVILWDDSEHTYEYVIRMMNQLFGHQFQSAMRIAVQVDSSGKAVCLTTTREHAELKRDQILAFGPDMLSMVSRGSMKASIEPIPED